MKLTIYTTAIRSNGKKPPPQEEFEDGCDHRAVTVEQIWLTTSQETDDRLTII